MAGDAAERLDRTRDTLPLADAARIAGVTDKTLRKYLVRVGAQLVHEASHNGSRWAKTLVRQVDLDRALDVLGVPAGTSSEGSAGKGPFPQEKPRETVGRVLPFPQEPQENPQDPAGKRDPGTAMSLMSADALRDVLGPVIRDAFREALDQIAARNQPPPPAAPRAWVLDAIGVGVQVAVLLGVLAVFLGVIRLHPDLAASILDAFRW